MTFPIPASALADHTAILGKTGAGKTSTTKLIVEHVVDDGYRVCVLDPIKSDWWGITSSADGKAPGLPFHILGGPRGHLPLHSGAGEALGKLVGTGALPLSILDMADFEAGGLQRFFSDFAHSLMKNMRGVLYLVVEEAHEFAPKERGGFGMETQAIHWAKKLATAGRSKGIRLIVATQRTQALHNAVLGSCETLVAHRLSAPADQKPVLDWYKANVPDKERRDAIIGELATLPTGTARICSGVAVFPEPVAFEKFRTFDNTATPGKDDDGAAGVVTAAVDQDALRSLIGTALKEAEDNDPEVLRAEIARLKKAAIPTQDQGEALRKEGFQAGFEQGMEAGTDLGLSKANMMVSTALTRLRHEIDDLITREPTPEALEALTAPQREPFPVNPDDAWKWRTREQLQAEVAAEPEAFLEIDTTRQVAEKMGGPPGDPPPLHLGPTPVTPARQRLLDTISWMESIGQAAPHHKQRVALMAGVSPNSGGYRNNLGGLRTSGLIEYPIAEHIALTAAGRAKAKNPGRTTNADVQDRIRKLLFPARQRILDTLIEAYPAAMSRESLAYAVGAEPTSGGFRNNLGGLRSLGVIDYPTPGMVTATKMVFPL